MWFSNLKTNYGEQMEAQLEQPSLLQVLELWWVPREPQSSLPESLKCLEDVATTQGDAGISMTSGVLENKGYMGQLERHHMIVKLIIPPPGPPYEASLAGMIKANRHPDYPNGLLLAPELYGIYVYNSPALPQKRLTVPLEVVHPEAIERYYYQSVRAYRRGEINFPRSGVRSQLVRDDSGHLAFKVGEDEQFDMVGTMPDELVDKFVIAAASAYYGATPMRKTMPKADSLLFYRQITCVKTRD